MRSESEKSKILCDVVHRLLLHRLNYFHRHPHHRHRHHPSIHLNEKTMMINIEKKRIQLNMRYVLLVNWEYVSMMELDEHRIVRELVSQLLVEHLKWMIQFKNMKTIIKIWSTGMVSIVTFVFLTATFDFRWTIGRFLMMMMMMVIIIVII